MNMNEPPPFTTNMNGIPAPVSTSLPPPPLPVNYNSASPINYNNASPINHNKSLLPPMGPPSLPQAK